MLTQRETIELRATVQRHQHPTPGVRTLTRFVGGPLDGLTLPLDAVALRSKYVGWVKAAAAGLVQCLYVPGADGSRVFAEYVVTAAATTPRQAG